MVEAIGYHGTNKSAADKIINNQHFIISTKKNEWLGHGVYLYELKEKAKWWASIKKNGVVLECYYNVEPEFLLNLDVPEHLDTFISFVKQIESEAQFILSSDEIIRRCQLLELYRTYNKHKVTTLTFESTNKKNKDKLSALGIIRAEKQICVHDVNCFDFNKIRVI